MIIQPKIFVNGGAERQIAHLANYLTDHNYRVAIFSTAFVNDFKKTIKEARLVKCNDLQDLFNAVQRYTHKFEICNPHNHPAELMFKNTNAKSVWQMNEPPETVLRGGNLDKTEIDYVRSTINKAVVISDFEKKRFELIYGFTPYVNYPAVRYSFFATPMPRKDFGGEPILLQSGYFTWTKNQKFTVRIFSEVLKEYPKAKLLLAGYDADPYAKEVRAEISNLGLEDKIIIMPYIASDEDFRQLYYSADLFLNPVYEQGGWATTFEAISSGLPTVVSDKFVGSNLVKSYDLGVVCSFEQFVSCVLDVLSDIKKHKEKTLANKVWIEKELTWDKFGERYEKIFEDALT